MALRPAHHSSRPDGWSPVSPSPPPCALSTASDMGVQPASNTRHPCAHTGGHQHLTHRPSTLSPSPHRGRRPAPEFPRKHLFPHLLSVLAGSSMIDSHPRELPSEIWNWPPDVEDRERGEKWAIPHRRVAGVIHRNTWGLSWATVSQGDLCTCPPES